MTRGINLLPARQKVIEQREGDDLLALDAQACTECTQSRRQEIRQVETAA